MLISERNLARHIIRLLPIASPHRTMATAVLHRTHAQSYATITTTAYSALCANTNAHTHFVLHQMFNGTPKNLLVVKHVRQFIIIISGSFTLVHTHKFKNKISKKNQHTHRARIQRDRHFGHSDRG